MKFLILSFLFLTTCMSFVFAEESYNVNASYVNGTGSNATNGNYYQETQIDTEEKITKSFDFEKDHYTLKELVEIIEYLKKRIIFLKWQKEGVDLQKKINSTSYVVIDITNEEVLLVKNPTAHLPIASITKLMSTLVVKENHETEQEIVLSSSMINTLYNKTPALFPTLSISIANLISASLIGSINDAAESLNYAVERDLIEMMNEKALSLSMTNTSFADAHGISSQNISSAQDLAKLMYYLNLKHPDLLEVTRKSDFWLADKDNHPILFRNLNLFHGVPEFIGGKTGFTNAAQLTFSGIFNFDDTEYIVVILYSKNRIGDTKIITDWLKKKPQLL